MSSRIRKISFYDYVRSEYYCEECGCELEDENVTICPEPLCGEILKGKFDDEDGDIIG